MGVLEIKNDCCPLIAIGSAKADVTSSKTNPAGVLGCWLLKGVGVIKDL